MKLTVLTALFLGAFPAAALAECNANYAGRPGTRTDGSISGARAGVPCHIPGYINDGRGRLKSVTVVRQPKAGRVVVSGSALIYTPSAAFTGQDSFFVRFQMEGQDGGKRPPTGVRFAVR